MTFFYIIFQKFKFITRNLELYSYYAFLLYSLYMQSNYFANFKKFVSTSLLLKFSKTFKVNLTQKSIILPFKIENWAIFFQGWLNFHFKLILLQKNV